MAFSLRSVGTLAVAAGGAFATSLPAGHAAGDALIWFGFTHSSSGDVTAPAGYTEVFSKTTGGHKWFVVAAKIDGGSESNPSATFSGTGLAQMAAFAGGPATITVDSSATTTNTSNTNATTPALAAPSATNCLVLAVGQYRNQGSGFSQPAGFTALDAQSNATVDQSLFWGYQVQTTPAAVGASSFAFTGTGSIACDTGVIALAGLQGAVLAGGAAVASSESGALSTAIKAAGNALLNVAAVSALTNWATVTLSGTLYTGTGGILDPNFWLDVTPGVGSVIFYDATNITIYPNAEVSSTTNNCSAVVQFFDGAAWSVGLVILTPGMVSYAHVLTAAAGALSTGITLAGAALSASQSSGSLTTGIQLASLALMTANAAGVLTTGLQLNAGALATTTASGALTGGVASLQGAATALATALGSLVTHIQAAGQVLIDSHATGSLTAQISFQGAANSLTQANAQLTAAVQLAGNADVVSTAAGAALIASAFAGAANILSTGIGSLLTGLLIAGNALVTSSATGDLTTGITLSGAAEVDTAAALRPVGAEGQYGAATINVLSQTGLPVALATFIQNSACIVSISYENVKGLPFVPSAVQYRVDDVVSGTNLVPWTSLDQLATSNAVTVMASQNLMVSLTRLSELHQILFQIIDGVGTENFASAQYALIRVPGVVN